MKLYYTVEIEKVIHSINDEELNIIIQEKNMTKENLNESFRTQKGYLALQNGFLNYRKIDKKNFNFSFDKEEFLDYLKKKGKYDLFSKIKINWIGLIFFVFPFLDKGLDIHYLITADFYSPIFFYFFLCSFLASFVGYFIFTFCRLCHAN